MEVRSVSANFLGLSRVTLHRPYLRECFVGRTGRLGHTILNACAGAPKRTPEEKRRADDQRHNRERRCGKRRVRENEQHDSADQKQRLSRKLGQVVAEYRLQNGCVSGEPARELACSALGEKTRREFDQISEEIFSKLRNHELRRRGEQIDLDEVEERLDREQD